MCVCVRSYRISLLVFILLLSNSKTKPVFLFSCVCECKCMYICVHECVCVRAQAGSGSPTMAAAIQDFQRSESDRLNEVKGHLEIALLEKHFLREYEHTHKHTLTTPGVDQITVSDTFWSSFIVIFCNYIL